MNPQRSHRFVSWLTLLHGPAGKPSPKRGATRRGRRLGFELCEDRDLLSGASITGVKFDTVNSNGFSAGDVPQGGVFIDLYKDDGDAVFNVASDTLADRQQTAAGTGAFAFNNVADGHYFIQEEVPAGTTQSAGPAFYTVDVVGGAVYTGTALNIDQFSDPNPDFVYFINAVNANPLTRSDTGAGILGGQRDLTVNVLGPSNPISANGFVGLLGTGDGVFNLGTASSGPGSQVIMTYDANGAGLATNLTAGGNNLRLDFDFLQVGTGTTMDMKIVLNSPGGTATFTTNITENGSAFSVIVPFGSFSTVGAFSFTNVSSAQFSFNNSGVQDVDFELNDIVGAMQKSTGYNFGNFPMPSCLAGFVYVDGNNNGNKDVNEPPISGVIVTLTGVNDLSQSVTQTRTTDGNGAYFFGSLRPGVYKLTETQPINFIDGKDTIGTPGGITTNDMFSNINLPAGFKGVNNDFGELGLTPTYSSKRSLLYPAPPVNLVAVYGTVTPDAVTNSAKTVTSAATLLSKPNTSPTITTAAKTAVTTTLATTHTSSVKVLVKPSPRNISRRR